MKRRACGSTPCIIIGSEHVSRRSELEAAINDNSGQCGSTAPCFANIAAANADASATVATSVTTITNELGGGAESSPVTEIQTSTTDDFFASVQANGLSHRLRRCLPLFLRDKQPDVSSQFYRRTRGDRRHERTLNR